MIIEINKDNLSEIDSSFLNKEYLLQEFKNNPFARVLVLKENKEIIGYIYYSDIYDRIEINQFEIASKERNKGYGNILLQRLINDTKKDITLEVRKNNIPAIKLYEKNNFTKEAIRKGYYNGEDGILMIRKAL